jgi:hypothetical protein
LFAGQAPIRCPDAAMPAPSAPAVGPALPPALRHRLAPGLLIDAGQAVRRALHPRVIVAAERPRRASASPNVPRSQHRGLEVGDLLRFPARLLRGAPLRRPADAERRARRDPRDQRAVALRELAQLADPARRLGTAETVAAARAL